MARCRVTGGCAVVVGSQSRIMMDAASRVSRRWVTGQACGQTVKTGRVSK